MKLDFKSLSAVILGVLGLSEWSKVEDKNSITAEEMTKLKNYGFSDKFLTAFKASLENDFQDEAGTGNEGEGNEEPTTTAFLRGLLGDTAARLAQAQEQLEALQTQQRDENRNNTSLIAKKDAEITKLSGIIAQLSAAAEDDPGKGKQHNAQADGKGAFNLRDDKQLGGLQGEMFSLDRPYNLRAKAALMEAAGFEMIALPKASSLDYSRLKEDLGAFYRIPWQQRLQSFLMELPSIESIFPLESGYQDLATLVNIWLGEFSQAGNEESDFDKVTKGSYEFDDETLRMFNVMFAHRFKNLKALEKTWIGTLNKEGSNPIKWSFIEYILAETAKKLHNEREQRRINGIRKDPNLNEPGKALAAADGLYEFLNKKVNGHTDINNGKFVYQIKPFELGELTEANIGEKVYKGTSMIPAVLRDSGNLALYMPSHFIVLYHKYNELHYGQNQDYKANIMYVKEYPAVKIIPVPNADNHHRIFWTFEGNIKTYEDKPGEMTAFNLEQEDWSLKVWSNWRESIWAIAVGFKYTKKEDMDYNRQMIFCNEYDRPASYFVDADKDKNPSAKLHTSIVTVANTAEFAITDIEDAPVGTVISLKCGSVDKGVKIEKSGNFELISEAWQPDKGDVIKLMKRADGKFIEIGRENASSDALQFAPDETAPSLLDGEVFVTGENTKATAITNFTDAEAGVVYTIYGSGSEYASTIATGGNFVLTEAMTLSEGKFIKLAKAADGKFYEVARG